MNPGWAALPSFHRSILKHRRVKILQFVKAPSGRWRWQTIPKNRTTGSHVWPKVKSNYFWIFWRDEKPRHYQKAGSTPSETFEAKRKKEFALAGGAVLQDGEQFPRPQNGGLTIGAAMADFPEFAKKKKKPIAHKRHHALNLLLKGKSSH